MPVAFTAAGLLAPAGTVLWIIGAAATAGAAAAAAIWAARRRGGL
jgi:hypothetical protein